MIRVTVWNENVHEKQEGIKERMAEFHPNGLHNTVADIVKELGDEVEVRTATLDQPEQGLPEEVLNTTDVLIWWGHAAHDQVDDALVERIHDRVLKGMGLIVLHSGHLSKILRRTLGTSCTLRWRDDTYERIFCTDPGHPIAQGIPANFELGIEECYGEYFDIAKPDSVIFEGWFDIGEVFRSGCTWTRGYGKIFYFQPGHETNGSFQNQYVRKIIQNAVKWAVPCNTTAELTCPHIDVTLEEARKA